MAEFQDERPELFNREELEDDVLYPKNMDRMVPGNTALLFLGPGYHP